MTKDLDYNREIGFPAQRPAYMTIHNNTDYIMTVLKKDVKHGNIYDINERIFPHSTGTLVVAEKYTAPVGPEGNVSYTLEGMKDKNGKNVIVTFYYDHPYGASPSTYTVQAYPAGYIHATVDNQNPTGHSQKVNYYVEEISRQYNSRATLDAYTRYLRPAHILIHNDTDHPMYYTTDNLVKGTIKSYPDIIKPHSTGEVLVTEYNLWGPKGTITYTLVYDDQSKPNKYVGIEFYFDHPMTADSSHYVAKPTAPGIIATTVDNPSPTGHDQTINFHVTMVKK